MSHSASRACTQYSRAVPPGCGCGVVKVSCSVGPAPGAAAAARARGADTRRAAASAFAASPGLLSRTRSPPIVHRNAPAPAARKPRRGRPLSDSGGEGNGARSYTRASVQMYCDRRRWPPPSAARRPRPSAPRSSRRRSASSAARASTASPTARSPARPASRCPRRPTTSPRATRSSPRRCATSPTSRSSASRATPRRSPKAIADVPSIARALAAWLAEQVQGDDLLRVRAGYHLQLEAARRPELRAIHVAWGQAVQEPGRARAARRRLAAPAHRREHPLERHRRPAPGRGDRAAPGLRAPRAPGDRAPALDPHGAVTPAALRRACLAMPGATETFPFGPENSVFKVCGQDLRPQPARPRAAAAHLAEVRAGARRAAAREPRRDHARLPPQQAPLEHRSSSTARSPTRWCAT